MLSRRWAICVEEPLDERGEGALFIGVEGVTDETLEFASLGSSGCREHAFTGCGEDDPRRSTILGVGFSLKVTSLSDAVDQLAGAADGDH